MTPPARTEAAIAGVYTTRQTREDEGRVGLSYALEAFRGALADAGLAKDDVQGFFAAIDEWPQWGSGPALGNASTNWASLLGIPIRWLTGAPNSGVGSGVAAVLDAAAAIEAGYIDTAVIVAGMARQRPGVAAPWTTPTYPLIEWTGSFTAAQFALAARRHMHLYGTTPEQFAMAASTIRNFGTINPDALFFRHGPYSVDDVLSSPMIADPLTRLMCAPANNGGGAIVLTTLDRARDLRQEPVRVLGGADQSVYTAFLEPPLLEGPTGAPFPTRWVDDGFGQAGVTRDDVDVVELYDGFASWVIMQWEMFGFCGVGEGGSFVESGAMAIDGRYPTCTDGGCSSFGDMGVPAIFRPIEAVRQLRGEIRDDCPQAHLGEHTHEPGVCRQAPNPQIAFAASMGPPTGGGQFVLLARDRP